MKIPILILMMIVGSSCTFTRTWSNIKFSEVIVELNNGEKIVGKVDFPLLGEERKLKIKQNDKTQKINKNDISKITFKSSTTNIEYYNLSYKDLNGKPKKNKKMLTLVRKGKVNLYNEISTDLQQTSSFGSTKIKYNAVFIIEYYCKRDSEDVATFLYRKEGDDRYVVNKNYPFKPRALKYFGDDEEIRQKIEKEEYNYSNIPDLINAYNAK